jgi:type II secretory pathway component PulF
MYRDCGGYWEGWPPQRNCHALNPMMPMFNLEQSIAQWRREMAAGGLRSRKVLDELESHLRDDFERRVRSGASGQEAFQFAVRQLGFIDALTREFSKIGETNDFLARIKNALLTLAGIPNLTLATNMNTTTQNTEPAWATYLKYGAFVFPAILLWLFIAFFVFPKFNEVVSQSGIRMPGIFQMGWNLALFLTHYMFIICCAVVLALGLLEWRFKDWRCYRRAAFGVGVFLLNSAVLIAITAMVVLALVAAPALAHHMK